MGLSKSQRIIILLAIDSAFFLVELIVGYAVHSLALVADAFHMLNDVLSLCVGLWAVKVANQRSSDMYTYGWQRAETLGALVNGVFLVALCMTIFLEAIQRFVEPQVVSNPKLVLIVGCLGLASNLIGLVLFHDHSHGGAGHSHGKDEHSHAEEGHSHAGHSHEEVDEETRLIADEGGNIADVLPSSRVAGATRTLKTTFSHTDEESTTISSRSPRKRRSSVGQTTARHLRRQSGLGSLDDLPTHPGSLRQSIVRAAQVDELSEPESDEARHGHEEDKDHEGHDHTHSHDHNKHGSNYGSIKKIQSPEFSHSGHNHKKPKDKSSSGGHSHGGHSHGDLNMRGVFLHVMGDALGNIGVIATALIIWLSNWSFRYYFDPAISIVITFIILASAIPLCKAASRILLQAVPVGMSIDEIKQDIMALKGVAEAHHLHVWQLSDTKLVASLHVKIDVEIKGAGSAAYMRLARAIRECLHEYGIHSSTIQPEFLQDTANASANGSSTTKVNGSSSTTNGSTIANDDSCLLECGDDCEDQEQCCPPSKAGSLADGEGQK